jgi:predicted nucleic-acid-binding protein
MIALDTNVLVRFIVEDDEAQVKRVRDLIARCRETGEPCLVSLPVVCELVWVLESLYEAGRAELLSALQGLLVHDVIRVEDAGVLRQALDTFSRSKGDMADHIIGALGRARGATTTYTFDSGLKRVESFTLL